MIPLKGESDERNDADRRSRGKPACRPARANHCVDPQEWSGNAQECLAKLEERARWSYGGKAVACAKKATQMNGHASGHRKPPLYWLTLALIYAGFIAVILT